jgi:hypothetical protein
VLPKLSQNKQFIDMFLDEARLGAYLNHSRCVQVFDIGQGSGSHFIVMEYVDGADLKEVLDTLQAKGRQVPVEVACFITIQICEGLEFAHEARDHSGRRLEIVHRDISPHNVLMTRYGEVKLVDFGLAKAGSHLTADEEDIVKGKFGYLAPEVTLGQGVDRRVDIFAVGILLWEMLAGRRLFLGETDLATFQLVQAAQIPDVRRIRPDVDEQLVRVINKALARDRDQRYQTAGAFAKDLSTVLFMRRRSVTYHDVAALVREAAVRRAAAKQADQTSVAAELLGDLIIEALHEFSGVGHALAEEESMRLGKRGIEAGGGGFVDIQSWGLEDDDEPAAGAVAPAPAEPGPPAQQQEPEAAASAPFGSDSALTVVSAAEQAQPAQPTAPRTAAVAPTPAQPSGSQVLPWVVAAIATAAAVAGWLW